MHSKIFCGVILKRSITSTSFRRTSSVTMRHAPLVVVLGATGAGKSKLALDIASRLNGEIVSADSMQVYKGLDIVTNKVSYEEQATCRHHLIGFLSPLQEYTITDFKRQALQLIDDIHRRQKLPVVCGGTNYYIESVLWEYLVSTDEQSDDQKNALSDLRKALEEKDSSELHKMLQEIDPKRSSMIHPHDRRKIIRSIEVFEQSGKRHSDLLSEQKGDNRYGGSLLFPNVCLIYVKCDEEVLKSRINKRVDKMIKDGLVEELKEFHDDYNKERMAKGRAVDYEHGIFQSIGFKEFHSYLTCGAKDNIDEKRLFTEAVERMKLSTWQYAKYQNKWIKRRIINRKQALPVYAVDSTKPEKWDNVVLYPTLKLLSGALHWDKFVIGVDADKGPFVTPEVLDCTRIEPVEAMEMQHDASDRVMRTCDACGGKIFMTEKEWTVHVTSKRHKRVSAARLKRLHDTSQILCHHEEGMRKRKSTE